MFDAFHHWLNHKLRVDAYELSGGEILSKGLPRRRIRLDEIRTWQSYYVGGGVPSICFKFNNGQTIDCSDRYEQLYTILHKIAADRELPFTTF